MTLLLKKAFCLLLLAGTCASAQTLDPGLRAAIYFAHHYVASSNQVYAVAGGRELKLDVWYDPHSAAPLPVLLNIHGGGWVLGSKDDVALALTPFLHMGFAVVNIDYRLDAEAPAPAAVEDSLCALHWIGRNAAKHGFDLSRIVVNGASSGGHLALITAMLPADTPFGQRCAALGGNWTGQLGSAAPTVAAVINWFGISDVADVLSGPNARAFALRWFGSNEQARQLARRVSPITYVRAGGVPVLTIHGDADPVVPYTQAVRLHQALSAAGVNNQLLTLQGAGHGGFSQEQNLQIYQAIHTFLSKLGVLQAPAPAPN